MNLHNLNKYKTPFTADPVTALPTAMLIVGGTVVLPFTTLLPRKL